MPNLVNSDLHFEVVEIEDFEMQETAKGHAMDNLFRVCGIVQHKYSRFTSLQGFP